MEWLDKVPEHWHVANIKRSTYLKGRVGWKGLTSNEFEVESYAYLVTGTDFKNKYVEWSFCYQVNEERFNDDPYIQLKNNDLLITKDGTIGKLAVVKDLDKPACLNSGIFLIRPEKYYLSEYMYYILKSSVFKNFFEIHSTGSTILHLYQNVFEKFSFAYPSFNEQKKIVSFLDTETTRIDNLIAKQEKLIELLEEQRKSIISHAVTKGLDPNAPMKDSGVEWLGDVPSHWRTSSIKYVCNIDTGNQDTVDALEDGKYPFFVRSKKIEKINEYSFDGEAVLTAGDGAGVGKIYHYINGKFGFHQRVYKMSNFKNILGKFFFFYFSSLFEKVALDGGAKSTVDSLRKAHFDRFIITIPEINEQFRIIEYIEHKTYKIDGLISKQKTLIEKLKEYRTSIISHAVTGKIDVREFC